MDKVDRITKLSSCGFSFEWNRTNGMFCLNGGPWVHEQPTLDSVLETLLEASSVKEVEDYVDKLEQQLNNARHPKN